MAHLVWTNSWKQRRDVWTNSWEERLDAVILGSNNFGLEDLSLTFWGVNNGIIADIPRQGIVSLNSLWGKSMQSINPDAGNIFLRRVRMRWLLYGGHLRGPVDVQSLPSDQPLPHQPLTNEANLILDDMVPTSAAWGSRGFLLAYGGRNIEICDCDLYSAGNVFNLVEAKGALIARNQFAIGPCGWANFDGCDGVICEGNAFSGANNMIRSGVTFWSKLPMRNTYFGGNSLDNVNFHDAEGILTDGASGKYFGPIVSGTKSFLSLPTGTKLNPDELRDHTCFVLGGTGKGQWRAVIGNTQDSLTVDHDWDIVPGSDSIIGVNHTLEHLLIVGNVMQDIGIAFCFYGTAMECIVAENRSIRSRGFHSYAGRYGGTADIDTQPQFFIQYLDNEIVEGQTPQTGRPADDPPGFYTCGSVNSILRITGDPGIALTGELPWKWPLAMGFVIRGNALNSDANIELKTYHCPPDKEVMLVEDVIVEGNKIALGETGIKVEERCAGVLIRGNKFNEVAKPLDVSDEAHVLIIQNWVVLKYE